MDKKRIIFLVLFILASLGIAYALYRVFFAKETALPPIGRQTKTDSGKFPEAGQAPTQLPTAPGKGRLPTAENVLPGPTVRPAPSAPHQNETTPVTSFVGSVSADKSGNVKYYNRDDGKFYRIGADGKPTALSDQVFYNADKVTWSPAKNETIIEYPDGSNIYYNFDSKKQVTLLKHWEDFSFAPQGDKIAAKSVGLDPSNRWLVTSDPDGSNITPLEAMGENGHKVNVDWSPSGQIVATSLTGEPLGADRQMLLLVGTHHENFPALIVEGRDVRSEWSPSGKRLMYSVYGAANDFKPQMWITDTDVNNIGANRRPLNLDTWADKCSFKDERYVYCGVPKSLEMGIGFEPTLADTIPDDLYRIDLQTGIKSAMALDTEHTIDKITFGENGKALFFTDKNKPGLFRVGL